LSGHPSRYPALPIADRLAILAVAVTQFLVGHGRVWTQPFDWDRSILWSYATIALLVFADLAVRRRLHLLGWFLHTLELSAVKFVLTAGFLVMYLITHPKIPDPGREPPQQPAVVSQPLAARRNLKPTVIAEGSRGEIHGRVIDRDGRGIQGALVFISDGLKDLVFAPPEEPVTLENNGKAFVPPIAAVQTGQPLSARSANHELHTLLLTKSDRSWVMNVPLLASGQSRTIQFDDARGLVAVHCTVHGSREGEAHLAILDHPFFAFSGVDGHFVLQRIPSGNLTISAFHPAQGESSAAARLGSGEKLDASLSLGGR